MAISNRVLGILAFVILAALPDASSSAAEIKVMISGGLTAAYKELVPGFEQRSGNTVSTAYGPSMGTTVNAIPVRLARGEEADVLIMVKEALVQLIEQGKADGATRVDLVRSPIGVAVRAGAAKPDISTTNALREALLAAKSVAYSDSASGVYVGSQLFKRLGIEDQMKDKARMIPAEPVAGVVARGEAELGFQQISELLPVAGAEVLGPIPADVQKITIFSAALATGAKSADAGKALIAYLAGADAGSTLKKSGLDPIQGAAQ
jgi:molybdate transport system substrate-binding protein